MHSKEIQANGHVGRVLADLITELQRRVAFIEAERGRLCANKQTEWRTREDIRIEALGAADALIWVIELIGRTGETYAQAAEHRRPIAGEEPTETITLDSSWSA